MTYNHNDIINLEQRYKGNFINSLTGFKSLSLIGTKSVEGNDNLAIFSSIFHLGANPALCGMIIRPNEPKQNTLGNILATKEYTINHINPTFYKQAHQCSAKYDEGISEFNEVGLKAEFIDDFTAPFVKESIIKFGCEFVQKIDIELNATLIIIGKIVKIIVPESIVSNDGFINLDQAQTITGTGLDGYYTVEKLARLSYAKVGIEPRMHE